jgi:hypothetical protein
MGEPLILVTKSRVKEGQGEALAAWYAQITEIVERSEPQLIAFNAFLSDDGSELTNIQVHPDTASMDLHMQVLRDNWDESWSEYAGMLEVASVEYYGAPSQSALAMDRELGIPVGVQTRRIGGFTRSIA